MTKEIIPDRQGIALLSLYIAGDAVVLALGLEAGRDMWIAVLLAIILGGLVFLVYSAILSSFPRKDIFEITELCFGKVIGKIVTILYIWFFLHMGSLVLRTFGEYINIVGLTETPRIVPMLFILFLCMWAVKEGIEVLGRWCAFFLNLLIPVAFIIEGMLISKMDFNNIRPILSEGIRPVLKGAFSTLMFPFGETIPILAVFSGLQSRKSPYKIFFVSLLIGGWLIFSISTITVLVLGIEQTSRNLFPSYIAVSRINIGDFLQRIEGSVAAIYMFNGFIKVSICLLAASKGISRLFGFADYRFLVVPGGLIMSNLSHFVYENTAEMAEWPSKVWPYYALPFEIALPVIILIGAKIWSASHIDKKK